jgi:8-oxo-dGTP pyrophosphatase MutT (NUDIX family)
MLALNLIVRAVIFHEGKFLVTVLDDGERAPFSAFLGGHVRVGETLQDCARREVSEEVGLTITPTKLLYIVENYFFRGSSKLHEIGYYFLCKPAEAGSGPLLDRLTPNLDELISPQLLSPQDLSSSSFQPEPLKKTLCEDARENFASCPRAVIVNELPGDVDAQSGVYQL